MRDALRRSSMTEVIASGRASRVEAVDDGPCGGLMYEDLKRLVAVMLLLVGVTGVFNGLFALAS